MRRLFLNQKFSHIGCWPKPQPIWEEDKMQELARNILSLVAHEPTEWDIKRGLGWQGMDTDCGDALSKAVKLIKKYEENKNGIIQQDSKRYDSYGYYASRRD